MVLVLGIGLTVVLLNVHGDRSMSESRPIRARIDPCIAHRRVARNGIAKGSITRVGISAGTVVDPGILDGSISVPGIISMGGVALDGVGDWPVRGFCIERRLTEA